MRWFLLIFGFLAAGLIIAQLTLGQLIVMGHDPHLIKAHQHTGYLTVVISLVYIVFSMIFVASSRKREQI